MTENREKQQISEITMEQQAKILRFWRDVEIFNIPSPPIIIRKITESEQLPWNTTTSKDSVCEHTVYLAINKTESLAKTILQALDKNLNFDEKDFERINGEACLAVFRVNQFGIPIPQTYTPASFIYGVEAYRQNKTLDGMSYCLLNAQKDFDKRCLKVQGDQTTNLATLPIDWQILHNESQFLFNKLGIESGTPLIIRIKSTEIKPPTKNEDKENQQIQPDMLNSFYLNTLDTLIQQCSQDELFGETLKTFLGSESEKDKRHDILKNPREMFQMLDPINFPRGRWPSPPKHHLMLAQQAAVSGILSILQKESGGLVAVNGPPGTGKTTLLSDIIAEVVVRRAENICKLEKPWHLFENKIISNNKGIYPLKQEIIKHTSIVVSSNNNSAVENISLDLPSFSKIAEEEYPDASYFTKVIDTIFTQTENKVKPWGLVAAALGNNSNRTKFAKAFFCGIEKTGGMKQIPDDAHNDPKAESSWHEAKELFLSIGKKINKYTQTFKLYYEVLQLRLHLEDIILKLHDFDYRENNIKLEEKICQTAIAIVEQEKPSLLVRLLGYFGIHTQKYKSWMQNKLSAQQNLYSNLHNQQEIQKQKNILAAEKNQTLTDLNLKEKDLALTQTEQTEQTKIGTIPDTLFFSQNTTTQHLSSVWITESFDRLRSQYFLAALKLHEATILSCSGKFAANFTELVAMLTSRGTYTSKIRRVLWDTLFFTVPLVSTTLASFDSLFSGMKQDSIGWLLIDEAGQATPQSTVGALWRAHRAVIIGDPQQIEPVLSIPSQLVTYIQQKHSINDDWSPKVHSVQTLADRTMNIGAWIGTGENAVWTGLPLRAHRRCADPMFTVSNCIAYDGQMVQANKKSSDISCVLGESDWFHVTSKSSENQIVPDEIEKLKQCLSELKKNWPKVSGNEAQIYIISPFKLVAEQCKKCISQLGLNNKIQAGTIHTFQGKEADIVFIVLGSAPGDAGNGSRNWVTEKPNILNVALTRAKSLVYIIGNREDWKKHKYFDILTKYIPEK